MLAADRMAVIGNLVRKIRKAFYAKDGQALAAYAGNADAGEEMLAWFNNGADPDKFPESQRNVDHWSVLLIVWKDGSIWTYERTPYAVKFPPQLFAIGSGRDFAMAAMYLGKTAPEAVEVACALDNSCGNGVDILVHSA